MVLRAALIGLMLLALLGFGGVAWVALRPPPAPQAEAPPERAGYLIAARPLRAGTLIKPEDLAATELVVSAAPPAMRRDTREARAALLGAMVRRSLPVGDPLAAEDVMLPGERGFLAAVLAPGMRAVSVGVDAVSGTAGLIWPGDRVDVVLTQQIADEGQPLHRRVAGETVLSAIRVIAIDQALTQGAAASEAADQRRVARTVTLEVGQREAERLAVATRLGRLSLAVRAAIGDAEDPAAEPGAAPAITWGGDVSPALRAGAPVPPPGTPAQTLTIFQGTAKREEFRF